MKKLLFILSFLIPILTIGQGTTASLKQVANAGNTAFRQLLYNANYGAQFGVRSLVDKGYVDSLKTTISTGLTIGTTAIVSGTNTRILYDNSGVLGEYTVTGSGTVAVLGTSPDFTTGATIGGVAIPTISSTNTLTNKRITPRAVTTTQSATPTINTDNTDVAVITGLAQAITSFTTNLSGTPTTGDRLRIHITDNATARAITWGSSFATSALATLPTTTVISTMLDVGFLWNESTSKWDCAYVK